MNFSISLENFKILNFFNLWALRAVFGCEIGSAIGASQSHSLSQRGSYSGRGGEAEIV